MVGATARDTRYTATALAARVWYLLEKIARTPGEDEEMVHAAHASCWHWGEIGDPEHVIRGEWLCSRVYAELSRAEPALHHARRCLDLCHGVELDEVEIGYAYEGLARAQVLTGDFEASKRNERIGRAHCKLVEDQDDRTQLLADLSEIARKRW